MKKATIAAVVVGLASLFGATAQAADGTKAYWATSGTFGPFPITG